ncbi:NAD(P)/FAD-dependent oxidoreductase [Patescibacteria group bacterium]|nr:NAD(P)/FAD-dependent oxidoreductase [Patescibacteria group bacterium]MBU1759007.1 NAD(P)/FAD-dependent oxidoreductase [Patescibacteria group bacterium]
MPKEMKKLILEKNISCGAKLLLSGGERCNVTNSDIDFERDYVGQNIKSLPSIFHKFDNQDMLQFLHQHGIETVVETHGRVMLKSGKARQLLNLLLKLADENNVEIKNEQHVESVKEEKGEFKIETNDAEYACKKLIIATGGKSYPQVGATSFVYDIAQQFDISCFSPYPCLCGIETVQDMSGVT